MIRDRLNSRGQEIVEYALILPLFLLLTFGIIDFGRTVFAYNSISHAAREGARAGVVPSATYEDIVSATTERVGGLTLISDDVTVLTSTSRITVQVVYDHSLITGPVIEAVGRGSTLQLTSVATMRRE